MAFFIVETFLLCCGFIRSCENPREMGIDLHLDDRLGEFLVQNGGIFAEMDIFFIL